MSDTHLPLDPNGEPLLIEEDGDTGDRFLVYIAKDGVRAELRVLGNDFWATRAQMATMFDIDPRTVSYHLGNIVSADELDARSVSQDSWLTAADGKTYRTTLYNLDAIIAVGYRVNSRLGTLFRKWATQVLSRYLTKGFVVDERRLKNPDGQPDHFAELLERIRDIRSSEKRMWLRIMELATFCADYDPHDPTMGAEFFADIQNALHWAATQKTAGDLVVERVDRHKPNAGVMSFDGRLPTVAEAQVAKNLLAEPEIKALNHITSLMLEFFDSQVEQRRETTLDQFQMKLRDLIKLDGRPVKPLGACSQVTAEQAREHASTEIKAFKARVRLEAEAAGEDQLASIAKSVKSAIREKKR